MAEQRAVSAEAFAAMRASGRPVVLRGVAADWPAAAAGRQSGEAAVAYLRRFSHPKPFAAIVGRPEIGGRFFYTDDLSELNFTRGLSPLDPFLNRLLRDRDEPKPFAMAVQSVPVPEILPGFVEENALALLGPEVVPRIWIGNAIRVAPHYDLMENIGVVVAGRRRFTLFPPDQIANLYAGPFELTPAGTPVSMVDITAPDLTRYPRFRDAWAAAEVAELGPGDAIYIPFHWWHGVDSLDPVNAFVNYWWNPAPKGMGNPYDALLLALFALRALPADQRAAWRTTFDHYVFGKNGDPVVHLPDHAKGLLGEPDPAQFARMRAALVASLGQRSD